MDKLTFGGVMIAFVGVIIALSILPQIASNNAELTTLNPVLNDSLTVPRITGGQINTTYTVSTDNAYSDWRASDSGCAYTGVVVKTVNGTTLTETTDYVVSRQAGTLTFKNTAMVQQGNTSNVTTMDYNYCLTGYVNSAAGRGVANLIVLICAIGLMSFVAYYFYRAWQGY